jgi:cobalt-zinc-cadmium efflux system outer membrane protein
MLPVPLTLQAAIELALKTHPDLRVAMADLLVARADSSFARVPAFNPELEVQATRGGGTIGSNTDGTLDLSLSQELEIWGKRGARQTAATARSRSLAAEWRAKLQEIESDVRTRFERALFLQERLQTVNDVTELDRRVVQATQARVRDGSMTPVTARLTELDWLRLEAQGRRTHSNLRKALVDLGLAVGMELPDSTQLSGEVQADSLEAPEDSVVVLALRIRATGEVLRGRIAERRAELQLAEREARPNLTLGVGLARDRASFDGAGFSGDPAIVRGITGARDTDNLWTARLSAPLPLWQTNQAGRARAAAEIMRSEADYDRYRVRTRLEVLGAVRQLQDAAGLYRLYLERSQRVRQDLALIREAYADGRISLDSYLTQKGRLVDTLLGQLEAGDAYWDARGQLEAVVGLDLAHVNAGAR